MLARLNGEVRSIEERSGIKNDRAWSMRFARVAFADLDFVEVLLSSNDAGVREGDSVDWVIRVETRGGYLSVQHHGDYVARNVTPVPLAVVAGE